jgi:hypothetical protein
VGGGRLGAFFRFVVARRVWVVAFYALLLWPAARYAMRVEQDNALDRLIIQTDPDYIATREFQKVFGGGEYMLLVAEAEDPFAPDVLRRLDALERALAAIPRVEVQSVLAIFRRAKAGFEATPEQAVALRAFATGTTLFARQGLVGPGFLGLPVVLAINGTSERNETMAAVDAVLADVLRDPAPLTGLRRIGQPYVNAHLDAGAREATHRYMPVFIVFVIFLNLGLYRSWRALLAFLITLGVNLALVVGTIGATGGTFTLVTSMVPMTVLITCTASLVYLHSRFVERPADRSVAEHQIFALCNKFLACTASIFATAVGFAALAVSDIRPIREMGLWVAIGVVFTWFLIFTLFPALQSLLRTPTTQERALPDRWFLRFTEWLPRATYRARVVLVAGTLVLCAAGLVALVGLPGVVARMPLEIDAIEYIDHDSALYRDTRRLKRLIPGLWLTDVWLKGRLGDVADPAVLRGLDDFQEALERDAAVGAVIGPTTILRTLRYVGGHGDRLPADDAALEALADGLDGLIEREPTLGRFVETPNLGQAHLSVISREPGHEAFEALDALIVRSWQETVARHPALAAFTVETVGFAPLEARVARDLVPTLVESFWLTVVVIFGAFLIVFRSGPARLMAMIPSLFAILVMFAVMRVSGMVLNIATILIASTVLGSSENDQIHFFYHFLENRQTGGSIEESLRHTMRVAGRAVFYATLINAGGFLAFALSDLPPVRQFGLLTALAFTLGMIADFTALPAALWLVFGERPDRRAPHARGPG